MKNNLIIKKCMSCGAIVKVLKDCTCNNCGIKCCGEEMQILLPNSVDAAIEKHVPTYEKVEDEILVKVNHVMEKEHFIEWIVVETKKGSQKVKLEADMEPKAEFILTEDDEFVAAYAYCNLHGLWKSN